MSGIVVGLLLGCGLFCIWWSCWVPDAGVGQPRRVSLMRPAARPARPGRATSRVGPREPRRAACLLAFGLVGLLVYAATRVAPVALCFAAHGGLRAARPGADAGAPSPGQPARAVARCRRQHHLRGAGRSRPARGVEPAGDPRTRGAAAGLPRLRRGLPVERAVPRLPRPPQGPAERPGRGPARRVTAHRAGGRGQRPRPAAAHPVDVPARGQPHPLRARDAPGLDGERRAARGRGAVDRARPCCAPVRSRSGPTRAPTGTLVLVVGAVVSVAAYRIMLFIGRLPEDERVLR